MYTHARDQNPPSGSRAPTLRNLRHDRCGLLRSASSGKCRGRWTLSTRHDLGTATTLSSCQRTWNASANSSLTTLRRCSPTPCKNTTWWTNRSLSAGTRALMAWRSSRSLCTKMSLYHCRCGYNVISPTLKETGRSWRIPAPCGAATGVSMIEAQGGADSGAPCETAGALTLCGHEELDATVQLSRARMKGRRIQITLRCVRVVLWRVQVTIIRCAKGHP